MLDIMHSFDTRAYERGRTEEPFPSVHVCFARPEEDGKEWRLDAITVLTLLIVNSGLIMAIVKGGAGNFESYAVASEAVVAVLWSLQALIVFLFFVVVARWLKS